MKLNNKGFAFSTMLYGTLSLITVILYAILSTFDSSTNTTYYYGEAIRNQLNECVYEEIALENCYTSGSATCDATSYHACLGISNHAPVISNKLIAESLKETKVTSGDGLIEDSYVQGRYIYAGNNVNNYINFSDRMWRILSVEPDGTVRLMDYTSSLNEKWDSNAEDMWVNSTLKGYLNSNYLATIIDSSKITSGKWKSTILYTADITNPSLDDYILQEQNRENEDSSYAQVGTLTIADYMKSTYSNECRASLFSGTNCLSWLFSYYGAWTMNINGDETESSIAYYLDSSHQFLEDNTAAEHRVYPVIVLNRNNIITGGTGTSADPYVLR